MILKEKHKSKKTQEKSNKKKGKTKSRLQKGKQEQEIREKEQKSMMRNVKQTIYKSSLKITQIYIQDYIQNRFSILVSRPYLLRTFFLIHPRFGAKDGLCCRKMPPGRVWKTTSNAFDKPCAEASSFMFCHGEKECHEMEQLRQDNQQETCSRRIVVTCCFPCSSP